MRSWKGSEAWSVNVIVADHYASEKIGDIPNFPDLLS